MEEKQSKERLLKDSVQALLTHEDLTLHKNLVKCLSNELSISVLECAAALSLINSPGFYANKSQVNTGNKLPKPFFSKQKVVRYRLDIGLKHQVQVDEIKAVLIEVSGVDKNRITRLDVRNHYTLVDLPDGMTADIFQLLYETEIKNKQLNIKRVKFHRRFHRKNNKQPS